MLRPLFRPAPHLHRRPLMLALVVALFVLALTPVAVLAAWATMGFSSTDESALTTWTNQQRASRGLPALTVDGSLASEARSRAKDMGDGNYYSHLIPPDSHTVFDELKAMGYCYLSAGENFAWNNYPDDQATATVEGQFAASSVHMANILGSSWTRLGIGAYKDADGNHVYVMLFSQPCSGTSPTPTPTPKPAATPAPTPRPAATTVPSADPTPTPSPAFGVLGITSGYDPAVAPTRDVTAPDPLIVPPQGEPYLLLQWLLDVFLAIIRSLMAMVGGYAG